MNPLLDYTLALMHLPAFHIPRASGKTTWEPVSTSTSTATPCFHAEILGSEPPGTPQIQQVYGAMNPLLAYTLALMHLPAFYIPRARPNEDHIVGYEECATTGERETVEIGREGEPARSDDRRA